MHASALVKSSFISFDVDSGVWKFTMVTKVTAARSDTVGTISHKFRAGATLNRACVGAGDIFFQSALAWNSGVLNLTVVVMVTAISRGTTVRSWGSFKYRTLAPLNRASAYFAGRVGGFLGHCDVSFSLDTMGIQRSPLPASVVWVVS